jgi:release factor glutamine methyltransferase
MSTKPSRATTSPSESVPYLAAEDSAFLRGALSPYSGDACLEIGAGNGGNLMDLAERFGCAVGTDVAKPGMDDWKGAGADYVLADGASCFRDAVFDLVAFNPPYLREETDEDVAVQGGEGLEVPLGFLRGALRVVRRSGRVVMVLDGTADAAHFARECSERGFSLRKVTERRFFFEELGIYEGTASEEGMTSAGQVPSTAGPG